MSAPRSALFFDIDGTLVGEATTDYPKSLVPALKKARENGHYLFINTGRTACALAPAIKAFPMDGFLCGCGTRLIYHGDVIFYHALDPKISDEIFKMTVKCHIPTLFEGTFDNVYPREISHFKQLEDLRNYHQKNFGVGIKHFAEDGNIDCDKILSFTDENSDADTFFNFVSQYLTIIDRGGNMYECVQKDYSKATAIEYIQKMLGLSMDQIYVFGDSMNDLSMFKYAKHTIAMGEHSEGLEPYTEYITSNLKDDGIAHALEHYDLI